MPMNHDEFLEMMQDITSACSTIARKDPSRTLLPKRALYELLGQMDDVTGVLLTAEINLDGPLVSASMSVAAQFKHMDDQYSGRFIQAFRQAIDKELKVVGETFKPASAGWKIGAP